MKDSTANRLLARLRELLALHGLTQETFAELGGFSYKYYQALEAGRGRDLRLSTLERLAKAYGVDVHELLSPQLPQTSLKKKKKGSRN